MIYDQEKLPSHKSPNPSKPDFTQLAPGSFKKHMISIRFSPYALACRDKEDTKWNIDLPTHGESSPHDLRADPKCNLRLKHREQLFPGNYATPASIDWKSFY